MRTRIAILLCAAVLATVAWIALPAHAANVLANPGFETGNLSGWTCEATNSVVTGQARTGTYAMAGAAGAGSTARCRQTVTVVANTQYTVAGYVKGSIVAFAESTPTPGAVRFALDPGLSSALGGYTDAQFRADIAAKRAQGKKVIISVGGERGTISVGDGTAAANFAGSVHGLMTTYGFDGVDIDLENGLNPSAMTTALRNLRGRVGANLVITLAPQTIDMQSTGGSYFRLALNIADILSVVHTQYYNSGTMLGCDNNQPYAQGTVNFIVALACIQLENGWDRLAGSNWSNTVKAHLGTLP